MTEHSAERGEPLIFLISLPRSGSTLLQHVLCAHSDVTGVAEPWLLFPSALGLRPGAITATYGAETARVALQDFVSRLPDGDEEYYRAVRKMASHLYERALTLSGKRFFLDKSSRYYLAVPEIRRVFPSARFVFLVRNPAAVLNSYVDVMAAGDLRNLGLPAIRQDLRLGYSLMRSNIRRFGDDATVVSYERLVAEPRAVLEGLCERLALPFEPGMLDYANSRIPGRMVDPKSIGKHDTIVGNYAEAWRERASKDSQLCRLIREYVEFLGQELLAFLGYDQQELLEGLPMSKRTPGLASWSLVSTETGERSTVQKRELDLAQARYEGAAKALPRAVNSQLRAAKRNLSRQLAALPEGGLARELVDGLRERVLKREQSASGAYQRTTREALQDARAEGWHDESVARRQHSAYEQLLEEMRHGKPRRDLLVAADALRTTQLANPTLLEVGCGSGYYSEVFEYLCRMRVEYSGVDSSAAMIELARAHFPEGRFSVGDATQLKFGDRSFDIVWSGTVLMHLVDYPRAIREACRVARHHVVFHSTPLVSSDATVYLLKQAYGGTVPEVIISLGEFEQLVRDCGFRLTSTLESLPYRPPLVEEEVDTLTHVFERLG